MLLPWPGPMDPLTPTPQDSPGSPGNRCAIMAPLQVRRYGDREAGRLARVAQLESDTPDPWAPWEPLGPGWFPCCLGRGWGEGLWGQRTSPPGFVWFGLSLGQDWRRLTDLHFWFWVCGCAFERGVAGSGSVTAGTGGPHPQPLRKGNRGLLPPLRATQWVVPGPEGTAAASFSLLLPSPRPSRLGRGWPQGRGLNVGQRGAGCLFS